ncbi:MAG: right-handed parallel beta-helix repeat-containing protein [Myxococcaceae bacterium]|nr:right-handed parallel beta-helix repeat-containing protein [Myxococcaceae bacterium]
MSVLLACGPAPSGSDGGAGGGSAAGGSAAGGSAAGGSTAGGSTAGGSTAGGSTAGGSTGGGSTGGGSTGGGSTAGGSTAGGSAGGGSASFTITAVSARVGGCTATVQATGAVVLLRENLSNVCLTVTGTGFTGVTAATLQGMGGVLASTLGAVSATSVTLTTSVPVDILTASMGQQRYLDLCLTAGAANLGCTRAVEIGPITASPSGQAGALGTELSPLPTLDAALAVGGAGSTFQVLGPTPWGPTPVLRLPQGASLRGAGNANLDGQSNASRELQLPPGATVAGITFTNFSGTALRTVVMGASTADVLLGDVVLSGNGVSLHVEGTQASLIGATMGACALRDGTGTTGILVRGAGQLTVQNCTLANNRGDAIRVEAGGTVRLQGVVGTSHLATTGMAGDDDGYLVVEGGSATVVSSSFSGSQRSAIVVKGTGNSLVVGGGTSFTTNGTMGQSYCTGIAVLGSGTTRVDRSQVMMANTFTDSCVGVYRAPGVANAVTIEDSTFVRTNLQFEGGVAGSAAQVTVRRCTLTNPPNAAGIFFTAAPSGLALLSVEDTTIDGAVEHGVALVGSVSATVSRSSPTATCLVRGSGKSGVYAAAGSVAPNHEPVLDMTGCRLEGNGWWGLAIENVTNAPTSIVRSSVIEGNGTNLMSSTGGVLVRSSDLRLRQSPVSNNRGYGVRTDETVGGETGTLYLEDTEVSGNRGNGVEATSGAVEVTGVVPVRNSGRDAGVTGHGVFLAGAAFRVDGGLRLEANTGDGLFVDRSQPKTHTVSGLVVENNAGAGVRLGNVSLAPSPAAASLTLSSYGTGRAVFANNAGGHIVDDGVALMAAQNVEWTVNVGRATVSATPPFVSVRNKWTQVNVNDAMITRPQTPMTTTFFSFRVGTSAPMATKTIRLVGVQQNGEAYVVPSPGNRCGAQSIAFPVTPMLIPFIELTGGVDCIEP